MAVDESLLGVLDQIYAAALDESLWPGVIETVTSLAESQAASFCLLDSTNTLRHPIFHYLNIENRSVDRERFMREYLTGGMMEHDPTVKHIVAHPGQKLVRDSALLRESEKDKLAYYDWHKGFSDTRHRMAAMISPAPNIHSGITLHRTRQLGDFEERHVALFQFLLPHLERAVRIGYQLGSLGAWQRASADLLDANARGILFLDKEGRVLFANRAASEMAVSRDGIVISAHELSLLRDADATRLRRLVGEALARGGSANGLMLALRPSGKRPYSILIAPLSSRSSLLNGVQPALCVVITDPERELVIPEDRLRELFGLTPAQSRLASRLAQGEALNDAAAALNIAYATARSQLTNIFRKTGTSRQGELVRLLLADVPSLSI